MNMQGMVGKLESLARVIEKQKVKLKKQKEEVKKEDFK